MLHLQNLISNFSLICFLRTIMIHTCQCLVGSHIISKNFFALVDRIKLCNIFTIIQMPNKGQNFPKFKKSQRTNLRLRNTNNVIKHQSKDRKRAQNLNRLFGNFKFVNIHVTNLMLYHGLCEVIMKRTKYLIQYYPEMQLKIKGNLWQFDILRILYENNI